MITAELHCHTIYSKDCLVKPATLVAHCRRIGIDRLAVTDHDHLQGALAAQEIDPQLVIPGEEIMTTRGELLAFYVQEEIPPGLSPLETIARLREQGAFISVSHPFDHVRKGAWQLADLLEITPLVDAIETFNSRCLSSRPNRQAQAFAQEYHLAATAGSDAHTLMEVGRARLSLPEFQDAETFRQALKQAVFKSILSPAWIHLTSRYASWYKRLGHG